MLKKSRYNNFDSAKCQQRWICYFDLLGFKSFVSTQTTNNWSLADSIIHYYRSREIVEYNVRAHPQLKLRCWSDSFVIYSDFLEAESKKAFSYLEHAARKIFEENIGQQIPIRGAISYGAVYLDERDDIFVGKALVEAYENAERQDMTCLLLCRSATQQMKKLKLPASQRLNYRRWKIPWKRPPNSIKAIYTLLPGESCQINGQNDCLNKSEMMLAASKKAAVKKKYKNTIKLITSHRTK